MAKITYMLKGVILVMVLALGSCTKWNYHDGGLSDGVLIVRCGNIFVHNHMIGILQ